MQLESPLALALIGLVYLLGFGGLSYLRRQGLSVRFALEGLAITALGTGLRYVGVPVHPLLFLVVLYVVTMRVRLLVDLGNWFAERGQCERALAMYNLGLRVGPDPSSRQLVLINHGVAQLKNEDPESAYETLSRAIVEDEGQLGGHHVAAAYYNLGLACRRSGREAEAIQRLNEAIDGWPNSIYGFAATKELEKRPARATPPCE